MFCQLEPARSNSPARVIHTDRFREYRPDQKGICTPVRCYSSGYIMVDHQLFPAGYWGICAVGFGLNLVLVLAAGLLMHLSTAFAIGVVSSVVGLGMAIAQDLGFLPSGADEVNAYTAWITQSMVLALIVGLLYATVNDIQRSLKRARQAEARLRGLIENTPRFVMTIALAR